TLVANEEAAARSRTRLSLHDNGDGTVASEAQVGPGGPMSTDWARARGEALCELIEHLPTGIRFHPRR
ncbi:MAG: hypothetical protein JWP74_2488, partial [Marmoricola sp.]|nr:hypothetical protein [Marmoricola sp.]